MKKVDFYDIDSIEASKQTHAVIVARYAGKWIFIKRKESTAWELSGGPQKVEEKINETAARKLFEDTGARKFTLVPICLYSLNEKDEESFGSVFYAHIEELDKSSGSRMQQIALFDEIPENLTDKYMYTLIFEKVLDMLSHKEVRMKVLEDC